MLSLALNPCPFRCKLFAVKAYSAVIRCDCFFELEDGSELLEDSSACQGECRIHAPSRILGSQTSTEISAYSIQKPMDSMDKMDSMDGQIINYYRILL